MTGYLAKDSVQALLRAPERRAAASGRCCARCVRSRHPDPSQVRKGVACAPNEQTQVKECQPRRNESLTLRPRGAAGDARRRRPTTGGGGYGGARGGGERKPAHPVSIVKKAIPTDHMSAAVLHAPRDRWTSSGGMYTRVPQRVAWRSWRELTLISSGGWGGKQCLSDDILA